MTDCGEFYWIRIKYKHFENYLSKVTGVNIVNFRRADYFLFLFIFPVPYDIQRWWRQRTARQDYIFIEDKTKYQSN
jgi:hypothetical protein